MSRTLVPVYRSRLAVPRRESRPAICVRVKRSSPAANNTFPSSTMETVESLSSGDIPKTLMLFGVVADSFLGFQFAAGSSVQLQQFLPELQGSDRPAAQIPHEEIKESPTGRKGTVPVRTVTLRKACCRVPVKGCERQRRRLATRPCTAPLQVSNARRVYILREKARSCRGVAGRARRPIACIEAHTPRDAIRCKFGPQCLKYP